MEKRILRLRPATPDRAGAIAYHPPVTQEAGRGAQGFDPPAKLTLDAGQSPSQASNRDWFLAAALTRGSHRTIVGPEIEAPACGSRAASASTISRWNS